MQEFERNTLQQYDAVIASCRDIFLKKAKDYGTSWRVLRPISIMDQLFIKAQRIRNIQEVGTQKIAEEIDSEFRGIVNYSVIALIQMSLPNDHSWELSLQETEALYDEQVRKVRVLMQDKNHDYGEAWRDMSQESFVDLILMKLQRVKQILRNKGKTLISEGMDANYTDMLNYAVFALIHIDEATVK